MLIVGEEEEADLLPMEELQDGVVFSNGIPEGEGKTKLAEAPGEGTSKTGKIAQKREVTPVLGAII